MLKSTLIAHLDEYLNLSGFRDGSQNGLQINNDATEITKVALAVDANTYLIDRAVKSGAEMLFVHHGMFWWTSQLIEWLHYERVSRLIRNNVALYGAHLPLDAHPEVGNNIELVRAFVNHFKITKYTLKEFGLYHGETIGFGVRFEEKIPFSQMKDFCEAIGIIPEIYNFGKKEVISSFAAISGGAGDNITDAKDEDYDLYLTGKGPHYSRCIWKELSQSVIYGWHYETETFWVKAVGRYLQEKFNLEIVFVDEKY